MGNVHSLIMPSSAAHIRHFMIMNQESKNKNETQSNILSKCRWSEKQVPHT